MNQDYTIDDARDIITPALILFRHILERNVDGMIEIAGDATRLRPHCKTHKMCEIIRLELAQGIAKHKAATFAEAEMLAGAGVRDICLAYPPVGPNISRTVKFAETFPDVAFSVLADHPLPVDALSRAMSGAGRSVGVLLDIDTGQHRTGIGVGPAARRLYEQIAVADGLTADGLHVYDGHLHHASRALRAEAIHAQWRRVTAFRDELVAAGCAVPRILAGGTGSFPVYAKMDDSTLELSPGTCVLHDEGYRQMFPDLAFTPAAVLLSRVISRPAADRITLDLGTKAVASDPPAGRRVVFPDVPDAKEVLHNEEHLVLETPRAQRFRPGDVLIAIPTHICPTTALYPEVLVVEDRRVTGRWPVAARNRQLTI